MDMVFYHMGLTTFGSKATSVFERLKDHSGDRIKKRNVSWHFNRNRHDFERIDAASNQRYRQKNPFINVLGRIIESEQKGSGAFGKISLSEKQ